MGNLYIQKCLELYEQTFPIGWINQYREDNETVLFNGVTVIENFYKESFILLSKAVISGEYIDHGKRCNHIISLFLRKISIEVDSSSIGNYYATLNISLKECLNDYKYLLVLVSDKVEGGEEYYLQAVSKPNRAIGQHLEDFHLVITLSTIDHFFAGDEDNRKRLIFIQQELAERVKVNNQDLNTIYKALWDKCRFLLRKVFYDPDVKKIYKVNHERYDVGKLSDEGSLLKDLSRKYNYLYNINNFPVNDFMKDIREYQQKSFQRKCKTNELVLLMKHYKKDRLSIHQSSNLLGYFDDLYGKVYQQRIKGEFDLWALNSIKNYLYNSHFAVKLAATKFYSFSDLKEDIEKIEEIQVETGVSNYFPFYKAIDFLRNTIEKEISSERVDISLVNRQMLYYRELLEKFEKALSWCKRVGYYPFQPLFSECITQADGFNIFVASSFARPINYVKLNKELADYKLKYSFLQNLMEVAKEKLELISIKDSIKNQERRNFEYLGVFIALITFLFASIPTFTSHELRLQDSLLNMLSLGMVLVLFVLLLKAFQNFSNKMANVWFGLSITVFGSIFVLLRLGVL